jgi:hypothetical protein
MRIGRRGVSFLSLHPDTQSLVHRYPLDTAGQDVYQTFHVLTFWNSVLVNTWNQSSFPAYKSRLWNKEEQAKNKGASSGRA